MSFRIWITNLFNKFIAAFNSFIKDAFDQSTKLLIGEFSEFAVNVITELATSDLTSESKRAEAIKRIKLEAIARGKELSSSVTNLLIELAVARLKAEAAKTQPTA